MAKKVIRYDKNPFLGNMIIPIGRKRVQVGKLGKDDNVLLNQNTGEITGTHVAAYKKVDSDEFVKIFAKNIALTFDLNSAGLKAFNVLIYAVQNTAINKDSVFLDSETLEKFFTDNPLVQKITMRTFLRGLSQLEDIKIIAKTTRQGIYYINPNFIFNGDRIAFTTILERKNTEELQGGLAKKNDPYTADLLPTDSDN